jgi:hypothetical protein
MFAILSRCACRNGVEKGPGRRKQRMRGSGMVFVTFGATDGGQHGGGDVHLPSPSLVELRNLHHEPLPAFVDPDGR